MAIALFTRTPRERLLVAEACPSARLVASSAGQDRYTVGECEGTCRYRVRPGDFVSQQILGCHNAVRTGTLACDDVATTLELIGATEAVIGIAGPDRSAEQAARALAKRFQGVLVRGTDVEVSPGAGGVQGRAATARRKRPGRPSRRGR